MTKLGIKSLNRNSILIYKVFIMRILTELNVPFRIINIPRKRTRITLLKSPHVNKKSREQFQLISHKVIFCILTELNILTLKYIILNKPNTVKVALFKY